MKEYCIYVKQGNARPYIVSSYKNLDSAKLALYNMIAFEEKYQRPYYVDNDFFENRYNHIARLRYFCIYEREVSEWTKSSENDRYKNKENKIVYFFNYKNRN